MCISPFHFSHVLPLCLFHFSQSLYHLFFLFLPLFHLPYVFLLTIFPRSRFSTPFKFSFSHSFQVSAVYLSGPELFCFLFMTFSSCTLPFFFLFQFSSFLLSFVLYFLCSVINLMFSQSFILPIMPPSFYSPSIFPVFILLMFSPVSL